MIVKLTRDMLGFKSIRSNVKVFVTLNIPKVKVTMTLREKIIFLLITWEILSLGLCNLPGALLMLLDDPN